MSKRNKKRVQLSETELELRAALRESQQYEREARQLDENPKAFETVTAPEAPAQTTTLTVEPTMNPTVVESFRVENTTPAVEAKKPGFFARAKAWVKNLFTRKAKVEKTEAKLSVARKAVRAAKRAISRAYGATKRQVLRAYRAVERAAQAAWNFAGPGLKLWVKMASFVVAGAFFIIGLVVAPVTAALSALMLGLIFFGWVSLAHQLQQLDNRAAKVAGRVMDGAVRVSLVGFGLLAGAMVLSAAVAAGPLDAAFAIASLALTVAANSPQLRGRSSVRYAERGLRYASLAHDLATA